MATYTPNYNLSKPEATDDFDAFRESYNDNMDTIDDNLGGGGGGGHTIVDTDGTDMPQENKLQFTGAVNVSDDSVNGQTVVEVVQEVVEVTEAEYEAIPVVERESNGVAYFIKDLNNSNVQGYPPLIYSDEEREVGVWRDGKPLYQKTIDCGALPNNTTKNVNHNVSDVETIFIVNAFGINSSKESYPIPFAHRSTTVNQIQINVDSTKITLGTGGSLWTSLNGFVTICYAKTTDTAGGGIWNGQGGLAHHYSTNETVVGTWIDGKPLYEKVVKSTTTPTANAWNTVALPADISVKIFDAYYVRTTGAIDKFSVYRGDSNPVEMLVCSISNSTVYYRISSPFVADFSEFVIIIQYTKTTD